MNIKMDAKSSSFNPKLEVFIPVAIAVIIMLLTLSITILEVVKVYFLC